MITSLIFAKVLKAFDFDDLKSPIKSALYLSDTKIQVNLKIFRVHFKAF